MPDIQLNDPYSQGESVGIIPSSDIVDWVLVELRVGTATSAGMRAAFLKNDGTIVDLDGTSPVEFDGISSGNYYIVVKHRNHLAVMSQILLLYLMFPHTIFQQQHRNVMEMMKQI